MQTLLSRMRELLHFVRPEPEPLVRKEAPKVKVYDRPQIYKLTSAQASLILFGHACVGDPGARDLMEILFPKA